MLIAACLSTLFALGEPVEIRYKIDQAEPLRYATKDVSRTQSEIMGQTTTSVNEIRTNTRTELIERRDDGTIILQNTIERVAGDMESQGVSVRFDSEDEDFDQLRMNPVIASLSATLDMRVQLHITPDGEVLGVPNMEEIERSVEGVPDAAVKEGLKATLNEESLIAMNESNYAMLPSGPVEIGDSWERLIELPFGGGQVVTMDLEGTLEDVERPGGRRVAVISIDGEMRMESVTNGVRIKITESEMNGTMRFDIEGGFMRTMTLESEMVFEGTSTMDGSVVVTQETDQTVSMRLIER